MANTYCSLKIIFLFTFVLSLSIWICGSNTDQKNLGYGRNGIILLVQRFDTLFSYWSGGASEIAHSIIPVIEAAGGQVLVRANVTGMDHHIHSLLHYPRY